MAGRPIHIRRGLHPQGVPPADVGYSPGMEAQGGRIIYVSGQGPEDLDADMATQMRQTFQRIGAVLAEAGAGFEQVVMIRAYFLNMKRDLPVFREVRREFLLEPYPASTAVGVTDLAVPRLEIEIEAVAVL